MEKKMEYPCYMYHKDFKLGKIFKNAEDFKEAGNGFVDSPAKLKKEETKKVLVADKTKAKTNKK